MPTSSTILCHLSHEVAHQSAWKVLVHTQLSLNDHNVGMMREHFPWYFQEVGHSWKLKEYPIQ